MAETKKRRNCPLCKKSTSHIHCFSPSCVWYFCYGCSARIKGNVVFDSENRYFTLER